MIQLRAKRAIAQVSACHQRSPPMERGCTETGSRQRAREKVRQIRPIVWIFAREIGQVRQPSPLICWKTRKPGGASSIFPENPATQRQACLAERPLFDFLQTIYPVLTIPGEFGHVFSWRHPPSPNAFGGSLSPASFLSGVSVCAAALSTILQPASADFLQKALIAS